MHQQAIAGIGNIYANEILFRARLHPDVQASRLPVAKVEELFRITRKVLLEAISCGGSSVRDFFAPDGGEGGRKAGISSMERKGSLARTTAAELSDAFRANGAHLSVRLAKHARLVDSHFISGS